MNDLKFGQLRKVAFLGCHSDDIEIGCGATIMKMIQANPDLQIDWLVFSGKDTKREGEANNAFLEFTKGAKNTSFRIFGFTDGYFPNEWADIKKALFEATQPEYDLVFTHKTADKHQDHHTLANLSYNRWRNSPILEYEIPKFDGDLITPNIYIEVEESLIDRKADILLRHFPTQATKNWFSKETFKGLAAIRGVECQSRFAEGFLSKKLTLSF